MVMKGHCDSVTVKGPCTVVVSSLLQQQQQGEKRRRDERRGEEEQGRRRRRTLFGNRTSRLCQGERAPQGRADQSHCQPTPSPKALPPRRRSRGEERRGEERRKEERRRGGAENQKKQQGRRRGDRRRGKRGVGGSRKKRRSWVEDLPDNSDKTTEGNKNQRKEERDESKVMERTRTPSVTMAAFFSLLAPLLPVLLLGIRVMAVCPSMCSCSRGHRVVDCSNRGLSRLPDGLQHNIRFLNLSHNHLQDLDGLLGHFAHLRTLDVSHNSLHRFPSGLPRALWDIRASRNRFRYLDKNATAYQWNLQTLDLSWNELDRVVFINNTLPGLQALNLSHNKFWTVPTNMPYNLKVVDLSHNYLLQILPGSLDRLPKLENFYLHGNRFAWIGEAAFVHLEGLKLLTLGDNPWACDEEENITHLLLWVQQTNARVLGCPCHTRHICGEAHTAMGTWHSHASYTEHPLSTDARNRLLLEPSDHSRPSLQAVTSGYLSKWALVNPHHQGNGSLSTEASEQTLFRDASTAPSVTPHRGPGAKTSTAGHTRSNKKVVPVRARSMGTGLHATIGQLPPSYILIAMVIFKGF
ncbi:hypothetical protein ACEWY4_007871 [Coilia grayii]|uniref:LRRNT domain-containing protein n=1 Tax=Coilia grayii TaxID=363190 RepID=A0ABD1K9B3_9TELE